MKPPYYSAFDKWMVNEVDIVIINRQSAQSNLPQTV